MTRQWTHKAVQIKEIVRQLFVKHTSITPDGKVEVLKEAELEDLKQAADVEGYTLVPTIGARKCLNCRSHVINPRVT